MASMYVCLGTMYTVGHERSRKSSNFGHMHIRYSGFLTAGRAQCVRLVLYLVNSRFSVYCSSVRPCEVWEGLGRSQWRQLAWHVCWFVRLLAAKGSKTMPVLSTVEAQLSLHKRKSRTHPQKHGNAITAMPIIMLA